MNAPHRHCFVNESLVIRDGLPGIIYGEEVEEDK
jgi:hypothetical protein